MHMLYLRTCMYRMVIIISDVHNVSDRLVFPQNLIMDKINEFEDVQVWHHSVKRNE